MDNQDYEALKRLHALGVHPECIFDVGASNGCWSLMASALFPTSTYVLFEPLIEISESYQPGMKACLLQHPDWDLRAEALGISEGTVQLTRFENEVGSTTLPLQGIQPNQKTVTVPVHSIDELVERKEVPMPGLIKIDTQGSELTILQGARNTLPHVEVLFLECWLQQGYGEGTPLFHELMEFLQPFGFRLWDFCGQYRQENGILVSQDMVFLNVRRFRNQGVEWIRPWDYPSEAG